MSIIIKLFRALFHPRRWLFGRYLHLDRRATFRIHGSVIDANTHVPIQGAEVDFLDTGLDYERSLSPEKTARRLGESNGGGQLSIDFEYFWGNLEKQLGPATGTFELWIRHPLYNAHVVSFDIQQLSITGSTYDVDLGTITLNV